jgi:hypothetical protein
MDRVRKPNISETSSRCLAKTSAFSLSLLAQLESGFRIGGIGVCGLLNFLLPSRLSGL